LKKDFFEPVFTGHRDFSLLKMCSRNKRALSIDAESEDLELNNKKRFKYCDPIMRVFSHGCLKKFPLIPLHDGRLCCTKCEIPDGVKEIRGNLFPYSSSITVKMISIPKSVEVIGDYAFSDCIRLLSITLPDNLKKIGDIAFGGCLNMTSIVLPDNLREIGYYAFGGTGLTSIDIPNNIEIIGQRAFSFCRSLSKVYIPENAISSTSSSKPRKMRMRLRTRSLSYLEVFNRVFEGCPIEDVIVKVFPKEILGSAYIEEIYDRLQPCFPQDATIHLNDEKVKLEAYLFCACLFYELREELDEGQLFEYVYSYLYKTMF
jgi:hypothetical protein